ncbi:DeoR/GlpR family DNA-binding transcription regulator [Paenibacillus campi]|uniref:DeoR/GlpR family DNA-binding transcription regulator n=1 Tax=Paenibacillus campi TaxID=3106031 RepID=UPI002AFE2FE1|nr:DeoR/GlpR family DNA-binding transcription regulator [Paenibacillus sp. SGZ-1014]
MSSKNPRRQDALSAAQRKLETLRILEAEGTVRVSGLSRRFNVTEETIRRDLERLELEGIVVRTHGGAVFNRNREQYESPAVQRETKNIEEKKAIVEHALSLIQPGDVIALDASTTCLHLVKQLPNRPLTVLTYSLAIANELVPKTEINVILIGGYLDRDSMANTGIHAEKMVESYHVDKFLFSCHGFDLSRGLTEPSEAHVQLKKKIIEISDELILLTDSSKFRRKSLVRFLGMEDLNRFITDDQLPEEAIHELEEMGVEVIVVD